MSDFIHSFKNKIVEANDIVSNHAQEISQFSKYLEKEGYKDECKENFFTILGYSYRLTDINQRLFYTFQEAVYAIDLDKLMRNDDSMKLNTMVYILVLDSIIKEYVTSNVNEEEKQTALEVYKKIEDRKAKENTKYHMYQN